jgi:superfamily II DNA or RNA helicase
METTIQVLIDSHLRLSKVQLKRAGISIKKLVEPFEYANPDFWKKQRLGFYTRETPRKISLVVTNDREILIPRGGWERLKKFMFLNRVKLEIVDNMISGTGPLGMIYAEPKEWTLNLDQLTASKMAFNFRQGLIKGSCGSGKTEILLHFISKTKEKTLVIVHTERLLKQWQEKAAERFFVEPKEIGLLYAKVKREKNFTIGLVRTVLNIMKKDKDFVNRWGCIVSDECHHCFTYQTLIGDKQIKDIKVGDLVPSFNPVTKEEKLKKVIEVFKRKTNELMKIVIDSEEFFVTPDHPFAVPGGFVKAKYLRVGSDLISFKGEDDERMQMRQRSWRKRIWKILFTMPIKKKREEKKNTQLYLRKMWEKISTSWQEKIRFKTSIYILFKRMFQYFKKQTVIGDNEKNESRKIRYTFRENEKRQSNVQYRSSKECIRNTSENRSQTSNSWWEWQRAHETSTPISERSELGNGSCCKNKNGPWEWVSKLLQNRRWKQRIKNSSRGGWAISRYDKKSENRQEERRLPNFKRVESIEILEQRSDRGFGECCPEGFVYNLKVEDTETYLIGKNKIGVHNCSATTFSELINNFPARYRIGATATLKRKDAKEVLVYDCFGSKAIQKGKRVSIQPKILFEITDDDLDRFGRIVPVDVIIVPTEFEFDLNLENRLEHEGFERPSKMSAIAAVKKWAKQTSYTGSLNSYGEMLDEMSRDRYRQARILEYLLPQIKNKLPSLLFADRRESCLEMQAWLKRRKINCGRLMGGKNSKEQDKTTAGLNSGELLCAVGTTVGDEGLDIPRLSRGFGCTPTASNPGRLTQQLGRFKRIFEGKTDAKYFYFWDKNVRGLKGHAREVFRSVKQPHRVWYSETPDNIVPLDIKLLKEIERKNE